MSEASDKGGGWLRSPRSLFSTREGTYCTAQEIWQLSWGMDVPMRSVNIRYRSASENRVTTFVVRIVTQEASDLASCAPWRGFG
jgi:hypothetical protein